MRRRRPKPCLRPAPPPHHTAPAPQVLVPKGYTKQYIDGEVSRQAQVDRIQNSFAEIERRSDITLVEGTGHVGVGSIIEMSNAQTAALIGADVVLVANGGLGSAFDELEVPAFPSTRRSSLPLPPSSPRPNRACPPPPAGQQSHVRASRGTAPRRDHQQGTSGEVGHGQGLFRAGLRTEVRPARAAKPRGSQR